MVPQLRRSRSNYPRDTADSISWHSRMNIELIIRFTSLEINNGILFSIYRGRPAEQSFIHGKGQE